MEKKIVGRIESVDLPKVELFNLDAKIDTGADSCSIHCDDIFIDDNDFVHFKLHDHIHDSYHGKTVVLPVHEIKRVKSSNGKSEKRVFIHTPIVLCGKKYMADISLTNRENMKYPMLIGRKFLARHYLVDVSKTYIGRGEKK